MVLSVSLPRLLNLLSGVNDVSMCNFIMVGRPLVISGLVVFSRRALDVHLPVVLSVSLPCRVSVLGAMKVVTACYGSMVRRFLVISGLAVLGRLLVVVGGMCEMF